MMDRDTRVEKSQRMKNGKQVPCWRMKQVFTPDPGRRNVPLSTFSAFKYVFLFRVEARTPPLLIFLLLPQFVGATQYCYWGAVYLAFDSAGFALIASNTIHIYGNKT